MKGLAVPRVIIVDDKDEEALPVIKALAGMGVPSVYFNPLAGSHSLPSRALIGVRLAILDMDLVGAGADDKSKAATLVSTLGKILSPDNGPYSAIIWTLHEELIDLFTEYVLAAQDVPKPILTFTITKDECRKGEEFALDAVSAKLVEGLHRFGPLAFLQTWEENSIRAAIEVTNVLSNLADGEGDNLVERSERWRGNLLDVMKSLAEEEAGRQLDADNCLSSLYAALNPLHADRMDSLGTSANDLLSKEAVEILAARGRISDESKARVNSMLHLGHEGPERISPGCIYAYRYRDERPGDVPGWGSLLQDLLDPNHSNAETKAQLRADCLLALVEISAICDHAQKKVRIPRFITGLLVPTQHLTKYKRSSGGSSFIWGFGPLHISYMTKWNGEYHLLLSARHILSIGFDEIKGHRPFARLRAQALAELQNWAAYYISRPGLMQLRLG